MLTTETSNAVGKTSVAVMKTGAVKKRIAAVKRSIGMQIKSVSLLKNAEELMSADASTRSVNARRLASQRWSRVSVPLPRGPARKMNCVLEIDGLIALRWFLVPPPTSTPLVLLILNLTHKKILSHRLITPADNEFPGGSSSLNAGGDQQQPAPRMSSRIESMGIHNTRIGVRAMGNTEASNIPGIRLRDDVWAEEEKLNTLDCAEMDKSLSSDEIKDVIDHMEKNKAAGPDGFPIEFYQHRWEIIITDIMHIFNDLSEHRIDLDRINYGIITLIPKSADADIIQKFRPICLLQVFFKIVTKALTVAPNPVMNKLLLPCQTAFIKGRYISDGVMLLQEILREDQFRKKQGVVLKIDFEKAYDKVNWGFLFERCKQKGFNSNWLTWIKKSVAGGTLSVKVNDKVGSYFTSHKGVRQGLADNLMQNGIAILQYADDTILLLQDDAQQAVNLKLLLYIFESMSGLKINFEKSEVMMILEDDTKQNFYAELFNCQKGNWPIKYLGTLVYARRASVSDMRFLGEKTKKKMSGLHGEQDASELRAGADGLLRLAAVAGAGNSTSGNAGRDDQLRQEDKKPDDTNNGTTY
ncbi:hypothetical protein QYE76_035797 [Lolium multiflorum]|uniref:Reverse transcriptase domain-containing protein n=1 Tax=Lolium multiflorum TaxID=4521 RepID=A0AAD8VMI0_LOLMU|nr:hypothetical protein QYE76_035797 [Lolium multiflorum]